MEEKVFKQKKFLPEMEYLLSLAIGRAGNVSELDWTKFLELAEKNRLEPLIVERVPQDKEELQQLCAARNRYSLLCMHQMQTLALVMGAFERSGIPALSLKGPILAMELYGNPALRQSRDLDILAPEANFESACRLLEQWGYREEITVFNKTPLRRKKMPSYDMEIHRV